MLSGSIGPSTQFFDNSGYWFYVKSVPKQIHTYFSVVVGSVVYAALKVGFGYSHLVPTLSLQVAELLPIH